MRRAAGEGDARPRAGVDEAEGGGGAACPARRGREGRLRQAGAGDVRHAGGAVA